jgi:hypothetical protein
MLKKFLSSIIKVAVTAGERRLSTATNPLVKRMVLFFVASGEAVLLALLDENKDNNAQLMAITRSRTVEAITLGSELGREKITAFKDVKLANAIIQYLAGVEEVLKALVDEDPNNEAQVLAIWERRKLALLGDSLDVVTDRLADKIRERIKDPILAGIIIEMLQSLDDLVKAPN